MVITNYKYQPRDLPNFSGATTVTTKSFIMPSNTKAQGTQKPETFPIPGGRVNDTTTSRNKQSRTVLIFNRDIPLGSAGSDTSHRTDSLSQATHTERSYR